MPDLQVVFTVENKADRGREDRVCVVFTAENKTDRGREVRVCVVFTVENKTDRVKYGVRHLSTN